MGTRYVTAGTESAIDGELRAVITRARPSPEEIVTIWPARMRKRVSVFIRVESTGEARVSARLDDAHEQVDMIAPKRTRDGRRSLGGRPLLVELADGRTVLVPWKARMPTEARHGGA
jgi:hypothetical protein